MGDPLAGFAAESGDSSDDSEPENQSDAESSEEEIDSEDEEAAKKEAKRKRRAEKREKKREAVETDAPAADFDGPTSLATSLTALTDTMDDDVEATDFNKYKGRGRGGRGRGGGRGGSVKSGRGYHKRLARSKARSGVEETKGPPRKRNRIVETQVVEHENFLDPTERDLFPREFARV